MRFATLIGALLASVLGASVCFADGGPTTQAAVVSAEQQYLKQHFLKVMDEMEKVAKALENKDPDSAAAIRAAIKQANDAAIANDIDAVAKALNSLHFGVGEATQGNVTSELKQVIETLRNGTRKTNPGQMDPADELARIDTMLEQMLARQRDCSLATRTVFEKSGGKDVYERQEQLQLKSLSKDESGLVDDAGKVLELIAKDGDSTVFTPALKAVQTDLTSVQTMLAGAKAGPLTQRIQADIENSLEKMLAAVREKFAQIHRPQKPRPSNSNPNTQPPPPPPEPFIPPLAELKLLLTMQKDVNGRTELLEKQANSGAPKDDLAGQNKVLAQREATIRDMTQKIASKMPASGQ